MANFAGGAICTQSNDGNLSITDSSFITLSKYVQGKNFLGGEIMYSQGRLNMKGTRIRSIDHFNEENPFVYKSHEQTRDYKSK